MPAISGNSEYSRASRRFPIAIRDDWAGEEFAALMTIVSRSVFDRECRKFTAHDDGSSLSGSISSGTGSPVRDAEVGAAACTAGARTHRKRTVEIMQLMEREKNLFTK